MWFVTMFCSLCTLNSFLPPTGSSNTKRPYPPLRVLAPCHSIQPYLPTEGQEWKFILSLAFSKNASILIRNDFLPQFQENSDPPKCHISFRLHGTKKNPYFLCSNFTRNTLQKVHSQILHGFDGPCFLKARHFH